MFKVVAKNFSILTAVQVAEAAIGFLFIALAARLLVPPELGMFILIGAYVRLVAFAVNAGVGPIAFRELARHRNNALELFEDIVSMRFALGITSYLVLLGVLFLMGEDRELLTLVAIAGIPLLVDPLVDSYAAYYTAHERVGIPAAYGLASSALSAAAGIAVLRAGLGLSTFIASGAVVSLVLAVVWTIAFRAKVFRFTIRVRLAAWRRLFALIMPFAPIHLCNRLNGVINVILLGRISGPMPMDLSVGYYGPAQSITNSAVNLVSSLRRALIPPVAARLSQGYTVTNEVNLALKLVLSVFALPLVLGTSFMAPELISLVFGEAYAPSARALVMLGWAGALQIAAIAPETFLFAHPNHRMQDYITGSFMSVLVNAVVCIVLIGEHGFVGAAGGAVAGRLVYFIYVAYYCRRQMGRKALSPQQFGDSTLLLISGFGVWYLAFAVIANTWVACTVAVILTLPLIAGFILYLRPQSVIQPEA